MLEEFWVIAWIPLEELGLEILSVVFLTCVGRRGARTQSKDVMFQFNEDLLLFSLGEERKGGTDLHMGATCRHG